MTATDKIKAIQVIVETDDDGIWGTNSQTAFGNLIALAKVERAQGKVHSVMASSFADPQDVLAFIRCKATGKSDQECFSVGDNGIGKWGDDTTVDVPMCALPPEDWQHLGSAARGARVAVSANGRRIICELRDTMPHKANIKNGAGIDLNPAAVEALGLRPPIMISATWEWA